MKSQWSKNSAVITVIQTQCIYNVFHAKGIQKINKCSNMCHLACETNQDLFSNFTQPLSKLSPISCSQRVTFTKVLNY